MIRAHLPEILGFVAGIVVPLLFALIRERIIVYRRRRHIDWGRFTTKKGGAA